MSRIAARQRIVGRLIGAGATSADAAVAFVPADERERAVFRRMHRYGAIVEVGRGRYWIDPARLDDFRSAMRRRVAAWIATWGIAATVVATAAVSLVE